MLRLGEIKSFVFARQASAKREFCARLAVPKTKLFILLNCYKHCFFVRTVKLWNELPGDIVEADSFQHFKSKLKMYLNI